MFSAVALEGTLLQQQPQQPQQKACASCQYSSGRLWAKLLLLQKNEKSLAIDCHCLSFRSRIQYFDDDDDDDDDDGESTACRTPSAQ